DQPRQGAVYPGQHGQRDPQPGGGRHDGQGQPDDGVPHGGAHSARFVSDGQPEDKANIICKRRNPPLKGGEIMRADMSMVLAANATVTAIRQDVASTGGSAPQTEFARMLAGLLQGGAKADGAVGSAMTLPAALWWILAPNAG